MKKSMTISYLVYLPEVFITSSCNRFRFPQSMFAPLVRCIQYTCTLCVLPPTDGVYNTLIHCANVYYTLGTFVFAIPSLVYPMHLFVYTLLLHTPDTGVDNTFEHSVFFLPILVDATHLQDMCPPSQYWSSQHN